MRIEVSFKVGKWKIKTCIVFVSFSASNLDQGTIQNNSLVIFVEFHGNF